MPDIKEITWETDNKEIQRVGYTIGAGLLKMYQEKDYAHLASELVHLAIPQIFLQISTKLCDPLSQILSDRVKVYNWLQGKAACESMMYALPVWTSSTNKFQIDLEGLIRSGVEEMPCKIATDLALFSMWCVWYGCKSTCKQEIINNSTQKTLQKCIKSIGHDGIIDRTWCACVAYTILGNKVIIPTWEKIKRGVDDRSINAIKTPHAATLQEDRRGRAVTTLDDLKTLLNAK